MHVSAHLIFNLHLSCREKVIIYGWVVGIIPYKVVFKSLGIFVFSPRVRINVMFPCSILSLCLDWLIHQRNNTILGFITANLKPDKVALKSLALLFFSYGVKISNLKFPTLQWLLLWVDWVVIKTLFMFQTRCESQQETRLKLFRLVTCAM